MMKSFCCAFAIVLILSTGPVWAQSANHLQTLNQHLEVLPANTISLVTACPIQLRSSDGIRKLPEEIWNSVLSNNNVGDFTQHRGIRLDFDKIERISLVYNSINRQARPDPPVILLTTRLNAEQAGKFAVGDQSELEKKDIAGKQTFVVGGGKSGFMQLGENLLAFGNMDQLTEFLTLPVKRRTKLMKMASVFKNSPLAVASDLTIKSGASEKLYANISHQFERQHGFRHKISNLNGIVITAGPENKNLLDFWVNARTPAGAQIVATDAENVSVKMSELLSNLMGLSELGDAEPAAKALAEILKARSIKVDGTTVRYSLPNLHHGKWDGFFNSMATHLKVAGNSTQAKAALRNIGIAAMVHGSKDPQGRLAANITNEEQNVLASWRVRFVQQGSINTPDIGGMDTTKPWDDPTNVKYSRNAGDLWSQGCSERGMTRFLMVRTPRKKGKPHPYLTFRELDSGTIAASNVLLAVQVGPDKAVPWTMPADFEVDPQDPFANFGNLEDGKFMALMCDGSVREFDVSELTAKDFLKMCDCIEETVVKRFEE